MKPAMARLLSAAIRRRWQGSTKNRAKQARLAAAVLIDLAAQVDALEEDNRKFSAVVAQQDLKLIQLRGEISAMERMIIQKDKDYAVLHLRSGFRVEGNLLRLPPPTMEPMPLLSGKVEARRCL